MLRPGAGLVIAVATTVTYEIVFNDAKQRELNHLKTYVSERTRREEAGFLQVQANLLLVRGQFLKRMEANRDLAKAREEALSLRARERELRELKSDFVSLVSHEFRTPLEIIISSVDNLQRYHERLPVEKREHLLLTINKAVRRMAGMMEEVLVLGRLEADRMPFKPSFLLPPRLR